METLALAAGWIVAVFVGLLASLVLWKIHTGKAFKELTANVVTVLTTSSTSALATGYLDVAKANNAVIDVISRELLPVTNLEAIPDSAVAELEAKVRALEDQIKEAAAPKTIAFQCQKDFENCLSRAPTKGYKAGCWLAYIVCLSERFVKFAGGSLNA